MNCGYVGIVDPVLKGNPLCHVCGAVMMLWRGGRLNFWKCESCGTTSHGGVATVEKS